MAGALACIITLLPRCKVWGWWGGGVAVVGGGGGFLLLLGVVAYVRACSQFVLGAVGRGGRGEGAHRRSASSYLPPCRRAVASSRWLIRKSGNVSQTHTHTHTCRSMLLLGPVAAGPTRIKYIWVCHGCLLFSFVFMMQKINCDLGKREEAR